MKKICYFIILISFVACDSLLDVNPSDKYSTDTFWLDEEQYKAALTGCYNNFYNSQIFFNGETEMLTPNSMAYNEANNTKDVARGAGLTTSTIFLSFWRNAYQGIGRANTLLDQIDNATFDEEAKNQMKGQALFIRALYYSYLTDLYGDCPLITETPDNDKHGDLPRTPKSQIVDQIITDLTEASALLPVSYSASNTGKITKGAALALKARVLLYNEKWAESAAAAKQVIDMGIYDLFTDYRGMYLPENENNLEVIFDIQYEAPFFMHGLDNTIKTLNRPAPTKNLVDTYLMTDGKSIAESPLYDPENPYENRDPRLHQSIVCIGYPYNGEITTKEDVVTTGFGQKKLTSYPDDQTIQITAGNSDLNLIVIRYAEVLLTYAEALNEANANPGTEVYWALNELRNRPSVNMPEIEAGVSKEEMRAIIRLERRIEMACEGLYYADIRRWGIAEVVNNQPIYNNEGVVVENRSFNEDRDYLWPIPADEVQENENLEQNPGW